jgi:hypothetical protein
MSDSQAGKEPGPLEGTVMSFGIYLTGFVVVITGLIYGACLMHVPTHWIVAGGLVLVGLGNTHRRQSYSPEGLGNITLTHSFDT